ncbi:hypothetical protein B0H10DRAFT_2191936 [Mycena sp. CBHHK59/15]|nr:hypothetical protein B0H10DRAFT_2191936 [Mycena sp. CBHHK59/15]
MSQKIESLIAIQPAPPRAPTRKQLRGGSVKWTLKHLPTGTSSQFTDEVVPLACELVGSEQIKPWAKLTVAQIQGIVDRVFGEGVHEVTPDGAWVGLLGYRLNDWRHGIAAQPHKTMIDFIDSYETSDEEDTNDDNPVNPDAGDAVPAAVDASATTADADARANASAKPLKFKFNMREGVAGFLEWCLQSHDDSGTMAFHWKTWGGGVDKKGFLQSYLILHAFTCHLACLEEIPGGYERLKSHPESVHELQFWRTGEYVNSNPNSPANHFSIDNYDDTLEIIQTANGKKKNSSAARPSSSQPSRSGMMPIGRRLLRVQKNSWRFRATSTLRLLAAAVPRLATT